MADLFYLYIGIFFFFIAFLQYLCGVAIYFSAFSAFTGGRIVKKEKEQEQFKTAILIQVATGCFFVLLELIF